MTGSYIYSTFCRYFRVHCAYVTWAAPSRITDCLLIVSFFFLLCLIYPCVALLTIALRQTKAIANVASMRPHEMTDLEMKLKLIKNCHVGKSEMAIAHHSGLPHSTTDTILKNENNVEDAVKGSASLRATRLTKV